MAIPSPPPSSEKERSILSTLNQELGFEGLSLEALPSLPSSKEESLAFARNLWAGSGAALCTAIGLGAAAPKCAEAGHLFGGWIEDAVDEWVKPADWDPYFYEKSPIVSDMIRGTQILRWHQWEAYDFFARALVRLWNDWKLGKGFSLSRAKWMLASARLTGTPTGQIRWGKINARVFEPSAARVCRYDARKPADASPSLSEKVSALSGKGIDRGKVGIHPACKIGQPSPREFHHLRARGESEALRECRKTFGHKASQRDCAVFISQYLERESRAWFENLEKLFLVCSARLLARKLARDTKKEIRLVDLRAPPDRSKRPDKKRRKDEKREKTGGASALPIALLGAGAIFALKR